MGADKTLIIGSCTVDIVIPTPRLPGSADSINSGVHHYALGGCAYNVSQMFRLLGLPYLHCVTIGSGIYGDFVKKELESKGIPIFRTSSSPHGACICLVEESGERSFIAYHGIEYKFDRSWFSAMDMGEFSSAYVCGLELEEDTGEEIVAFLEEKGFRNIYFAPGPRLLTIRRNLLDRLMALKPIIHLNDKEVTSYTGLDDIDKAAMALYEENRNDVIVTMAEEGAMLFDGSSFIKVPVEKCEVVDSVGAGDCHLGTYASFRAMGTDKRKALEKANLFASRVVQHVGSTLDKEDLESLL